MASAQRRTWHSFFSLFLFLFYLEQRASRAMSPLLLYREDLQVVKGREVPSSIRFKDEILTHVLQEVHHFKLCQAQKLISFRSRARDLSTCPPLALPTLWLTPSLLADQNSYWENFKTGMPSLSSASYLGNFLVLPRSKQTISSFQLSPIFSYHHFPIEVRPLLFLFQAT